MQYFGIDIGDGETAVAMAWRGTHSEPQILRLHTHQSQVTALGVGPGGVRHAGYDAFLAEGVEDIHLRFKRQYLHNPASHRWIEQYAAALLSILIEEKHIEDLANARFFIGCPSGWDAATRDGYRQLMLRAGYPRVDIVSESRAALIYVRETGELRVSRDQLLRPTLIIDAGSSTTDYTFVENLTERQLADTGEVSLGAGLIDELLLRANIDRHPERDRLLALFAQYPRLEAICEMEARRLKENYFNAQTRKGARTYPQNTSVRLYTDPDIRVDMECDDALMDSLLNKPLPALGGESYLQFFESSLHALDRMEGVAPEMILMTGGASRMGFMRDITQQAFEGATIVQGNVPEFAIAYGLCYALRMEDRREQFLADVQALLDSDEVEAIIEEALPSLFAALAPALVDQVADVLIPDVFTRWRRGEIRTLSEMTDEAVRQTQAALQGEDIRQLLRPVTAEWLNTLRPRLEELTNPICDRYELPRTSLRLPDFVSLDAASLDPGAVVDLSAITIVIDVAVTLVAAMLFGGGGVALVAGGPIGLLVGAAVGIVTAAVGNHFVEKFIKGSDIPTPLRMLIGSTLVTSNLQRNKPRMVQRLREQLQQSADERTPGVRAMIDGIAATIERQLHSEMENALVLIR